VYVLYLCVYSSSMFVSAAAVAVDSAVEIAEDHHKLTGC
jgi:hypothetical protein